MSFDVRSAAAAFSFPPEVLSAAEKAARAVGDAWERRDALGFAVSAKVIAAFARAGITDAHLHGSVGPGLNDPGREVYEKLLATLMGTEAALARIQFVSGTQAIIATIEALAPHGGSICSLTGRPYDTLRTALADDARSLTYRGRSYYEARWESGARPADADVEAALRRRPDVVFIQRSRGYAPRPSLPVAEIGRLVAAARRQSPQSKVVVDNCYGEFVEESEPGAVGADAVAGSLIKNPGGGMAPAGAYVAGTREVVALVADHFFAAGLGAALGPTLSAQRCLFAGLHRAPRTVAESLKILDFAAALFQSLGYGVDPLPGAPRSDVIQAIRVGEAGKLIAFANGLRRLLPVNAAAAVEPGAVPGYADPVVMASGAFITGSTLELSCDAPMRPPFEVYLQGGFDIAHGVLATMSAAAAVVAR